MRLIIMRRITDKQIIAFAKKHRKELFADIENNLCLEHYNTIHKTNLTENDAEFKQSVCYFCKKEKSCIKN